MTYEHELKSGNYHAALKRILRDRRFDRVVLNALADKTKIEPAIVERMVAAYERNRLEYATHG